MGVGEAAVDFGNISPLAVAPLSNDQDRSCPRCGEGVDMTPEEVQTHKPKVVFVDEENKISRLTNYEKHGRLEDM